MHFYAFYTGGVMNWCGAGKKDQKILTFHKRNPK